MSSNILSRFLPPTDSPSVYEAIREHDAGSDSSDVEERAGLAHGLDHGEHFSDGGLEEALADATRSEASSPRAGLLGPRSLGKAADRHGSPSHTRRRKPSRPRWMTQPHPPVYELDDRDGDVPPSLLVEGHDDEELKSRLPPPPHSMPSRSRTPSPPLSPQHDRPRRQIRQTQPISGTSSIHPVARWFIAQQHPSLSNTDPKKKAMWRWANVENLDNFLKDVYTYFLGNGFWSILLSRTLNLLYAEFLALSFFAMRPNPRTETVFIGHLHSWSDLRLF